MMMLLKRMRGGVVRQDYRAMLSDSVAGKTENVWNFQSLERGAYEKTVKPLHQTDAGSRTADERHL